MDQIDHKILTCLKDNARQKASAISDEINLSVSSVIDRIHKMETSGIIQGYTVVLDQKRLGNDVTAVMEVSLEHPNYYDDFVKMVQEKFSWASAIFNPLKPLYPSFLQKRLMLASVQRRFF